MNKLYTCKRLHFYVKEHQVYLIVFKEVNAINSVVECFYQFQEWHLCDVIGYYLQGKGFVINGNTIKFHNREY